MRKSGTSIHDVSPEGLARLLGGGDNEAWGPEDLAAILRHQLTSPLALQQPEAESAGVGTYEALLTNERPPVDVLAACKDHARECRQDAECSLPPEVATVLYYACIAAGIVSGVRRITSLEDKDLKAGFLWGAAQPWVGEPIQSLLQAAIASLPKTV